MPVGRGTASPSASLTGTLASPVSRSTPPSGACFPGGPGVREPPPALGGGPRANSQRKVSRSRCGHSGSCTPFRGRAGAGMRGVRCSVGSSSGQSPGNDHAPGALGSRGRAKTGVWSPLGEWHHAAPAGRYSAKAVVAARGTQHTGDVLERRSGPGYSADVAEPTDRFRRAPDAAKSPERFRQGPERGPWTEVPGGEWGA